MYEFLIFYVIISYSVIGLLDIVIILFFDGKVSAESILIFILAPIAMPFVLLKLLMDLYA
jgi:hypothetical protein